VITLNNFCPLINGQCNPNCVLIEKGGSIYGLSNYCSFAGAIKKSETAVIDELKKIVKEKR